jgi:hypothetical protein
MVRCSKGTGPAKQLAMGSSVPDAFDSHYEVEIAERCLWAWQDPFDKSWVLYDIEKHTESSAFGT